MDPSADLEDLLPQVSQFVSECGDLALQIQSDSGRRLKGDGSVVTRADTEIEARLRPFLKHILPGSSVWGEEQGREAVSPAGHWLVDPVDGTTNYSCGLPTWGVSVGLFLEGKLRLGVISLPAVREQFTATLGGGAFLNGRPLDKLKAEPIQPYEPISIPENLLRREPMPVYEGRARLFGSSVFNMCSFAAGRLRAHYGYEESLYDVAAGLVIAREVGGIIRFTDGGNFDEAKFVEGEPILRPWIASGPRA